MSLIFAAYPNARPKEKNVGGHSILCPPSEKVRGHVPRDPHLIVPMGMPTYTSIIKFYAVCF